MNIDSKVIWQNLNLIKISTLVILLGSGSALAGAMGDMVLGFNPKESVYLGGGIGASINNDKFTASNFTTGQVVNVSSNSTSAQGNVFLGYGHTFYNSLYLGAEANIYTPRKAKFNNRPGVTFTSVTFDEKYTIDDYLAVDLLPGYRVNSNLLVYGRAGMSFRNANFNQQSVPGAQYVFIADSTNSVDGRFGAGVTYALNEKFAASVDYFYSYAPTFETYLPVFNNQFDFKSSSNYVGVSVVYTV